MLFSLDCSMRKECRYVLEGCKHHATVEAKRRQALLHGLVMTLDRLRVLPRTCTYKGLVGNVVLLVTEYKTSIALAFIGETDPDGLVCVLRCL
jgi:hypothetical protein